MPIEKVHPTPINLYFKEVSGWANITDLSSSQYLETALPTTGNVGYRFTNPSNSQEHFIVENRGDGDIWAEYAPDKGILIWHVDEAVSGNNNQEMTPSLHYQVSLEQQDGQFDLENNRGDDSSDAFDQNSPVFNDSKHSELPLVEWGKFWNHY